MTRSFGPMRISRWLVTAAASSLLVGGLAPAHAQDGNTNARLTKVESEVRALQRKVFPGTDGKYFEPEITAPPTQAAGPAVPTTTPISDLLTRMDAVERQMAQLTAQVEQNTNRISQLESKLASGVPMANTPMPLQGSPNSAVGGATVQPVSTTVSKPVAANPVAPPSARVQAVQAVVKPQTADAGDDEYSYGYRLWEAKFYPEAQQQLKLFLEKYPRHTRASWGRNLLGRAYLDDGNPNEAAKWFLQNFQADKRGDRAPDSLLYLAVSMKQLKDTKRSCIALAEFSETYAAEAAGRLSSLYNSTRNGLSCN